MSTCAFIINLRRFSFYANVLKTSRSHIVAGMESARFFVLGTWLERALFHSALRKLEFGVCPRSRSTSCCRAVTHIVTCKFANMLVENFEVEARLVERNVRLKLSILGFHESQDMLHVSFRGTCSSNINLSKLKCSQGSIASITAELYFPEPSLILKLPRYIGQRCAVFNTKYKE